MSIALSQILSTPVEINNIRANRKPPGLKDQHLVGLLAMIDLFESSATGHKLKSSKVTYFSSPTISKPSIKAKCSGAGSVNLVSQILLPSIVFSKPHDFEMVNIEIQGGTIGNWAPTYMSIVQVLMPLLEQFGVKFEYELIKHGLFPDLIGRCILKCPPLELPLKAVNFTERGNLTKIDFYTVF